MASLFGWRDMQSATGSQLAVSLSDEAFGGSTVLVHT